MSGYTGLVRAKEPCHIGGVRYSRGDVFTVADRWIDPLDPYEPVRFVGYEPGALHGPEMREVRKPIYQAINEPLAKLNRRGFAREEMT